MLVALAAFGSTKATATELCLNEDGPLQVVSGFFNEEKFDPEVEPNKKFDARTASFEYPESISHAMVKLGKWSDDSPNMCWVGGFFTAALSWHGLDISWDTSKKGPDDVDGDRGEMKIKLANFSTLNSGRITSFANGKRGNCRSVGVFFLTMDLVMTFSRLTARYSSSILLRCCDKSIRRSRYD